MTIISGEKIQSLCDVYCGTESDFSIYNRSRTPKNTDLNTITQPWDNPTKIYCYGDSIDKFISLLPLIKNNFIFISHNSDKNITAEYLEFLNSPKLLFWHAQNVMFNHPKLGGLPIGIANSTWPHGNIDILTKVQTILPKTNDFYFYFSMHTNWSARSSCRDILSTKGLSFGTSQQFEPYLESLASYKYAICPPGNGIDSHRIWECYYLNVIPIVKRSIFTERLAAILPCIVLDDWTDFNAEQLISSYAPPPYSEKLDLAYIQQCIDTNTDYFSGADNNGASTFECT